MASLIVVNGNSGHNTANGAAVLTLNTNSSVSDPISNGTVVAYDPNEYRRHTHIDHIFEIPDTYIGSTEKIQRMERTLDLTDMANPCFIQELVNLPEGCERIFLEILSNSGDNVQDSREKNFPIGKISIQMDRQVITIRNNGIPIPVIIHPKEDIYTPELTFGHLLTSKRYDQSEAKKVAGRNGYGAKLCNIFSTKFTARVGDPYNGLQYYQQWGKKLDLDGPSVITEYHGEPFVEISYQMDFQRFGYTEYPDEAFRIFARHAADVALTCKVPVYFNKQLLPVQDIAIYAKWFLNDQSEATGDQPRDVMKNHLVHYEWPRGTLLVKKKGRMVPVNDSVLPMVEMCIVDTPYQGSIFTFVNGIITRDGGVHVDSAIKALTNQLLETLNNNSTKKKDSKKETKSRSLTVNAADVKRHTTLIMSCRLVNPKFTSQMKTKLSSPRPKIIIPEFLLKKVMKWELVDRLYAELEAKLFRVMDKTGGRKSSHINIPKLEDANFAGKSDPNISHQAVLYICEGDSAKNYVTTMIAQVPDGRNTMGVLPIRGKMLNVMKAKTQRYMENKEIDEIKKALNLQEKVDYGDDTNYVKLRYGAMVILADSDVDGKHIIGLILNFFHCRFPSLLKRGYVMFMRTPIIRVKGRGQSFKFYTASEYNQWKAMTPDYMNEKKWDHKYFKGLGSSNDADIKEDLQTPRYVKCLYDELCSNPKFFNL